MTPGLKGKKKEKPTYRGDDRQRVEKRAGKGPAVVLDGPFVAEVPERLDHVALEVTQMGLHLPVPLLLPVLRAARQVPDPGHGVRPVRRYPLHGAGVVGLALDHDEHERAGDGVADHQANDADVAKQKRDELTQVVFALLRPRFLPLVVVPSAAPFALHHHRPVAARLRLTTMANTTKPVAVIGPETRSRAPFRARTARTLSRRRQIYDSLGIHRDKD